MQAQLDSNMLLLISDNRSGGKLELVFMTLNERQRIETLLSFYGSEFDIVILDGGSTDGTCDYVNQNGGTVYKRIGENVGENHFVYYVNNLSKSGRCFYMMCDEFVEIEKLKDISKILAGGNCQVLGNRIDWFYGIKARKPTCLLPKGFKAGDAAYNPVNFHDTLTYRENYLNKLVVEVDHLHIFNMKEDYGKFGYYIFHEVSQLRKSSNPIRAFAIRFIKLLRNLQLGVIRFPKSFWLCAFLLAQFFCSFFLFLMSVIEQSKLKSKEEQLRDFESKYTH